jgi:hypothetical protein
MPAALRTDTLEDAAQTDAWEKALLDHQLAELSRLAAMGMDMAATIARRVTADDGAAPVADLRHAAIDFARVARAGNVDHDAGRGGTTSRRAPPRPRPARRTSPAM